MTAPDRIWISPLNNVECNPRCQGFTGEEPDWQHGSWYPHDISSVEPNSEEYIRADLAPTPLADALAVPEVAREALMVERIDDVAEICRQFGLSEPRFRAALRAIGERANG